MRDVVLIDNCTSGGGDLEIHPSGRNEASMMANLSNHLCLMLVKM